MTNIITMDHMRYYMAVSCALNTIDINAKKLF